MNFVPSPQPEHLIHAKFYGVEVLYLTANLYCHFAVLVHSLKQGDSTTACKQAILEFTYVLTDGRY